MKNKLKKPSVFIPLLIIIALAGWYFIAKRNGNEGLEFITVERGTITQEVTVTGKTKPVQEIDLSFERSGRVTNVGVAVGSRVQAGEVIARLDGSELAAQLAQANASVDAQVAKLDEIKRGKRPEEIRVKETELAKAQQDLDNYYEDVEDAVRDAYAKAEDALRNKLDGIFNDDETISPQLSFGIYDSQLEIDMESARGTLSRSLVAWKVKIDGFSSTSSNETKALALEEAKTNLSLINSLLVKASDAVAKATSLPAATASTYKTDIATARGNINTETTDLNAILQNVSSQRLAVQRIQDELNLARAEALPETVRAQEAQIRQAQANADSISAQLAKTVLRTPIAGVVTKQDAKLGQIVGANTSLFSIISDSQLEIEANIPEVDIGKIALGNPVAITLDAFPGDTFTGKVANIDPAETIIDGVVNFKVKIVFDKKDTRFKSGLTANLAIETLKKESVLILPQYAIIEKDDGSFVRQMENNAQTEKPILTGIRGKGGLVEVLEGVTEGQEVLNIGVKSAN
jgi:HlyD family secretion protein